MASAKPGAVQCGTGVQSLTIIALHRALAAINGKSVIFGLEEPETNLHPQAQREVIRSLRKNVEDEADLVDQVVFTTHSTIMIDGVDHMDVALFRKIGDDTRGFRTSVKQLPRDFYDRYDVEHHLYYQFHHYRNSDFFYAKAVVIAESKNDAQAIQELMRKEGYDLDNLGVSIVTLNGVSNLTYAISIVRELGLPMLVVVDKDFFLPYENDTVDASRDANGFPRYRKEYSAEKLPHICKLIVDKRDRDALLPLLVENHTKALEILARHCVVCMRWSLEVDLVNSEKGRELLAAELRLTASEATSSKLLTHKKRLKRVETLTPVIRALPKRNYPSSYSKLRDLLKAMLDSL